jgi:hypothetical protein
MLQKYIALLVKKRAVSGNAYGEIPLGSQIQKLIELGMT